MSLYPESVARCQHIKVNGTQCGSPALRDEMYCFFHMHWRQKAMEINLNANIQPERSTVTLPVMEDANSVQMGLGEVMRLLVARQIDHRTAALLLYAMQTASANLKRTSFEPELPTQVVIDRDSVAQRPLGATAWSRVEGREYDEGDVDWRDKDPFVLADEDDPDLKVRGDHMLKFTIDREIALDPACADRTLGEMSALLPKESTGNRDWHFPDPSIAAKAYAERKAKREGESSDPLTAQNFPW